MFTAPATQPESNWDVIKRSWNLYSVSFVWVFILGLILSAISFIPRTIDYFKGRDIFLKSANVSYNNLWLIAVDMLCLVVFTCIMWRIRCFFLQRHERLREDFNVAFQKWPFIIVATLLQMTLFFILQFMMTYYFATLAKHGILLKIDSLSFFLILIPLYLQCALNLYIAFLLIFYLPLIVTENSSVIGSIKRSAQLVWGNWFRVLVVQTFPFICYVFFTILVKMATHLSMQIYFCDPKYLTLTGLYAHFIIFAVFIPWWAASLIVQLHDLELRQAQKVSEPIIPQANLP